MWQATGAGRGGRDGPMGSPQSPHPPSNRRRRLEGVGDGGAGWVARARARKPPPMHMAQHHKATASVPPPQCPRARPPRMPRQCLRSSASRWCLGAQRSGCGEQQGASPRRAVGRWRMRFAGSGKQGGGECGGRKRQHAFAQLYCRGRVGGRAGGGAAGACGVYGACVGCTAGA